MRHLPRPSSGATGQEIRPSQGDPGHANRKNTISVFEKFLPYLLLFVALLFVAIVRFNLLGIPFERDEGIYNYFGLLVLEGKTPYLDFYELKPPGLYYAYALLNLIFGSTLERSHLAFMIINLLTVVFLFLTGKRLLDNLSGAIVAASYGILALGPHVSGFTAQSEHLVAFLVSSGLLAMTVSFYSRQGTACRAPTSLPLFLAGLLFGLSMTIKQTGLFFVLFGGVGILAYHLSNGSVYGKGLIKPLGAYCAGALLVVSVTVLLVVSQGAFTEFLYWTYEYPKLYVSRLSPSQGWKFFRFYSVKVTENYFSLWISAGIGLFLGSVLKWDNDKKAFIWLLTIFSVCAVFPGLRFYGHYWIQLLPALSLLIGVAFYSIRNTAAGATRRINPTYVSLGLFLLCILPVFLSEKEYYFNPDHKKILRDVYGSNPFPEAKVIGDYIRERTDETDQVALIGSEPEVYYYANRRAPSKHAYFSYLVKNDPRSPERQREFIRDLEKAEPKYLVFFLHQVSLLVEPKADRTIFPWLDRFADRHYKLVGFVDVLSREETIYVWGDDAQKHEQKGKYSIRIYERK